MWYVMIDSAVNVLTVLAVVGFAVMAICDMLDRQDAKKRKGRGL